MIVGYLLAACAALASGTGSVLESIGIRRAGIFGGTSFDLVLLRRQYVYFLGLCADLTGFVLAAAALHLLPLFLVQSVIAFSVGVTAVISALLGIRLAGLGWIALAVGAGGLLLLGLSAEPTPAHTLPAGWGWMLPAAAVPVAALGYLGRQMPPRVATPMLAFAAGLGFSVVGIAARTLHVPDSPGQFLQPGLLAIVVNGAVAATVFAMSLQRGGAAGTTGATAIMFTTTMTVPSLIGLLYLDDQVRPGFAAGAVVGFALAVTGAIGAAFYASARHPSGASVAAGKFPGEHRTGAKVTQIPTPARD